MLAHAGDYRQSADFTLQLVRSGGVWYVQPDETFAAFVRDVFLAKASYLRAAFRAVDEAGGMRAYLTGPLGLQSALLDRFCAAYTRA